MPMELPPGATPFARARLRLAQMIATRGLSTLGEVALTGSASRGVSDRWSDIELHVWRERLPSYDDLAAALSAAGCAVEPLEEDGLTDGVLQVKSWCGGVFVETICSTWDALDATLTPVLDAATSDHWTLTEVWHVVHAIHLGEAPLLAARQTRLAIYPPPLRDRLVHAATAAWADPHWYPVSAVNLWPLVYRDTRLAIAAHLQREVEKALRLLWAINEQWEPDWKWLAPESARLRVAPVDLVARVNEIMTVTDPVASARACLTLILAVLDLAPARYDLERQKTLVREALTPEALLRPVAGEDLDDAKG